MFQWNAVDTSPDLGGHNVLKTFIKAIRPLWRNIHLYVCMYITGRRHERNQTLDLFSLFMFKNIFLALLRWVIAPPRMDPPLTNDTKVQFINVNSGQQNSNLRQALCTVYSQQHVATVNC